MNVIAGDSFPEHLKTSQHLAEEAAQFANRLAAGEWESANINKVESNQSIAKTTFESEYENGPLIPIYRETTVTFLAQKMEDKTGYVVKESVSREIEVSEIPKSLFTKMYLESSASDKLSFEAKLDTSALTYVQQHVYIFSDTGEIDGHITSYLYKVNGYVVDENDRTDLSDTLAWSSIVLEDGTTERIRNGLGDLNADSLLEVIGSIDAGLDEFLIAQANPELDNDITFSKKEHISRILGMITLLRSGMVQ